MTEIADTIPEPDNIVERWAYLDGDNFMQLPEIPYQASLGQDGIEIVERAPIFMIPKSKRHLYQPASLSPERADELNSAAQTLGMGSFEEMTTTHVDVATLRRTMDPILLRYISDDRTTTLDAAREIRRSALENAYAKRVVELSRQLLQDKAPELCPEEETVALVDGNLAAEGIYLGRFGGKHLMTVRADRVTLDDIAGLRPGSSIAQTGAHELIHQKHAEMQNMDALGVGAPDATSYNQPPYVHDPLEVKQLRDAYESTLEAHGFDPTDLKHLLSSHLVETIAYLGEAEVSGYLEDTRVALGNANPQWPGWEVTENRWVETFAAMRGDSGSHVPTAQRLMQVDMRVLDTLSPEEIRELIENPIGILDIPMVDTPESESKN